MEAILEAQNEVFYATFPDARPGPRSARAEAEHARLWAPPELAVELGGTPLSLPGAAPPLDYGGPREYQYADPATSEYYLNPRTDYWQQQICIPMPPPHPQRPALHADMTIARAVGPPSSLSAVSASTGAYPSPPRPRPPSPPPPTSPAPPPTPPRASRSRPRPRKRDRENGSGDERASEGRDSRERERERDRDRDKKPPLACLFCRGRKIACGPPQPGAGGCNQCQRRSLKCEYPAESRRGMRKKKAPPASPSAEPPSASSPATAKSAATASPAASEAGAGGEVRVGVGDADDDDDGGDDGAVGGAGAGGVEGRTRDPRRR
ncbi:hypothetical protein B0H17DRAFT_1078023 [Mycena rosella]|uniref:Zn(2)-C6 fungal-type domain-containing protein n=1 Tax=Mycena rosella TaxID=1033263 RepID=A0AAD7D4I8_MYCRO|nr:hypothetical protein B0H17DRAFT_1078023 [Mycena rosella]